ncbi:3-oxoacyl-ACP synthase III family protein [Galactobacter sp.]|uniref:3-oxoacyl-ACP synthase III family protein n=1 Tax=Galactobacter sp. TaxID=2676125 RepID=UPI0025BA6DD3|nr:ketoacyl-ACP synthase III [Galactobacter sp.]
MSSAPSETLDENPGAAPVSITGTGSYVPPRVVTNDEIGPAANVDDAWVQRKTGIVTRHWADDGVATSDLAIEAARRALVSAGVQAEEITLLVVATSTPDHSQPPTAAIVQGGIGATNAVAFDLNAVCSGFAFALSTVSQMLMVQGGKALVIGADLYSRILNPADRKTVILFGDGAGAAVVAQGPTDGGHRLLHTRLHSYGHLHHVIKVPAGGTRLPLDASVDDELKYFTMDGRAVRDFVAENLPGLVTDFLAECGVEAAQIRHFVPHQANGVMLKDIFATMDLPQARIHLNVDEVGNTGSASIPMMLDEVARADLIAPGEKVLLAGFGGGMAAGLALIEW